MRDQLLSVALQSGALFLFLWIAFRVLTALPANAKAWIWRLAFLKPLLGLLPAAVLVLPILPAPQRPTFTGNDLLTTNSPALYVAPLVGAPLGRPTIDPWIVAWAAGVFLVGGYQFWEWARTVRIARRATPLNVGDIPIEGGRVRFLRSSGTESALLLGGWRPCVIVPASATGEDLRLMLAHEEAHLVRRDLFWFGLMWLVQTLFFFNPMVWVAVRCARLDHESATDRHASEAAGVPIQTYAEMLLRTAVVVRRPLVPGVVPMSESFRTIHRRIEAMRHFDQPHSRLRRLAIGAVAFTAVALLPAYQLVEAAPTPQADKPKNSAKSKARSRQIKARTKATKKTRGEGKAAKSSNVAKSVVVSAGPHEQKSVSATGNASVAEVKGGSVSGTSTVSTGGLAEKEGKKFMEEFMKSQPKPPTPPAPGGFSNTSTAGPNEAKADGSASGSATGSGATRIVRIVDGKEEVVESSSTEKSTSGTWSNSYSYSFGGSGTRPNIGNSRTSSSVSGSNGPDGLKVSFKFENYDAQEAIKALFKQVHKDVDVDRSLHYRLTMAAYNIPFDKALESLLKAANATARVEKGKTIIQVKRN